MIVVVLRRQDYEFTLFLLNMFVFYMEKGNEETKFSVENTIHSIPAHKQMSTW